LGVKYEQEHSLDNLLKNLLCEVTTSLAELVRSNNQNSEEPFKDACEHLLKYYYEQQWSRNQEFITPLTSRTRRTQAAVAENVYTSESSGDSIVSDWGSGCSHKTRQLCDSIRLIPSSKLTSPMKPHYGEMDFT
jgi:uncharacterized SAM-dependent methyltransferase